MQASTSWASTLVWLPDHNRIDVTYDPSHTASNYEISISVIGKA